MWIKVWCRSIANAVQSNTSEIRLGCKIWSWRNRLEHLIQFKPYQSFTGSFNKELKTGALVVLDVMSEFSNDVPFQKVKMRFFSFPKLMEVLKSKDVCYTGTTKLNKTEDYPLKEKEIAKSQRGLCDY